MGMSKVGLKEAIAALRLELAEAARLGDGEAIKFEVPEVEMEFQVMVEDANQTNGGVKFWVVEMGGNVSEKVSITHKLKVKLKPKYEGGEPIEVKGQEKRG
jgi:hypothetical protein